MRHKIIFVLIPLVLSIGIVSFLPFPEADAELAQKCIDKVWLESTKGRKACVTPTTAEKLVERGWGTLLDVADLESAEKIIPYTPEMKIDYWTDEKYDLPIPEIYLDQYGLPLFNENIRNKQDFFKWKELVLNEIDYPINKGELNEVILLEEKTQEGYIQKKYSIKAFDGDTIIFYELLPIPQLEKIPAVFLIPGSGNNSTLDAIGEKVYVNYSHNEIGKKLVKKGYAVFAIENRGWGERSVDFTNFCKNYDRRNCEYILLDRYLGSLGISLRDLYIHDSNFLINYIKSLDYIDKQKIGIIGLSLGAFIAKDVSIMNPEIGAIVLASGAGTFVSSLYPAPSSVGINFHVYPDEYALLAPRPLYLSWGEKEIQLFVYELETHRTADFLNFVYDILDAKENLTVVFHDGGHGFHVPSVLRFLDEAIGPEKS